MIVFLALIAVLLLLALLGLTILLLIRYVRLSLGQYLAGFIAFGFVMFYFNDMLQLNKPSANPDGVFLGVAATFVVSFFCVGCGMGIGYVLFRINQPKKLWHEWGLFLLGLTLPIHLFIWTNRSDQRSVLETVLSLSLLALQTFMIRLPLIKRRLASRSKEGQTSLQSAPEVSASKDKNEKSSEKLG